MPIRDATGALLRALTAGLAGSPVRFDRIHSRDWASGTFAGTRHRIVLHIGGDNCGQVADAFIHGIEEREFDLGRYLLADMAVPSVLRDGDGVRLTLEALTVEYA